MMGCIKHHLMLMRQKQLLISYERGLILFYSFGTGVGSYFTPPPPQMRIGGSLKIVLDVLLTEKIF